MKSWRDIGFEVEMTGDGSPSLRLLQSIDPQKDKGEVMHHSGGAFSETCLLYGEPAKRLLQQIENPAFLVVGLGLGYIELCIAREALLLGKAATEVRKITSYESVPELREFFHHWIFDENEKLHREVCEIYDLVMKCVLNGTDLTSQQVKEFLKFHFPEVASLGGALASEFHPSSRYNGFMYDAFSSKTSPHLWEENFLSSLLREGADEVSLLTTYACKGSLKRALKANNFEVHIREGFAGKRNSTLGTKGIFL